jgi:hypothetical protein
LGIAIEATFLISLLWRPVCTFIKRGKFEVRRKKYNKPRVTKIEVRRETNKALQFPHSRSAENIPFSQFHHDCRVPWAPQISNSTKYDIVCDCALFIQDRTEIVVRNGKNPLFSADTQLLAFMLTAHGGLSTMALYITP